MNGLDLIILVPLLFGLIRGLMRGLISEIIAFAVIIIGAVGSRFLAPYCAAWLLKQFAWSEQVCEVVAYVVLFLAIGIALALIAKLLTRLLRAIHLGGLNRLAGGLIGLCKFGILVLIVVFAMDKMNEHFHWFDKSPAVQQSVIYPYAVKTVRFIENLQ